MKYSNIITVLIITVLIALWQVLNLDSGVVNLELWINLNILL